MNDDRADHLRAEIRAALAGVLPQRRARRQLQILGAGDGPDALATGREYLRAVAPLGYATPSWPTSYGGADMSPSEAAVLRGVLEEFEIPDLYPFSIGLAMAGPIVIAHGNPEQHARWLPSIPTGDEIWCQMFSEPDAGSDLAALTTRATRDGDEWIVTGRKVWTSRAHYARWGLLLARTDSSVPKHRGITTFVVDMNSDGLTMSPIKQMNGDEHFNEIVFDDVRIADTDRIGDVGDGWRIAMATLAHERNFAGSETVGVQASDIIDLVREAGRENDPIVRQMTTDIVTQLEIMRFTGLRSQAAQEMGATPGPEGSGGKVRTARLYKSMAHLAMHIRGADGMLSGDVWNTLLLTSPSMSIRGGTDEIQRNIIGERVLGLPSEPRVDKEQAFFQGSRTADLSGANSRSS